MPGKYWSAVIDAAVDNGGYVTPSLVDVPAIELRKMVARGTLAAAAHGVACPSFHVIDTTSSSSPVSGRRGVA